MASNNKSSSSDNNVSSKERLRWTQHLHDLFVQSVNSLGGPDRATPKSIVKEMKAMGVSGITIYHVKSHLQKYRISKLIPESTTKGGKLDRRNISDILPNFSTLSALQLKEVLQIQMEEQKRLNDHLEVEKSLKLKMEAQVKYLDRLIGQSNQNRDRPIPRIKPTKPLSSLPSLSEVSDDFSYDAIPKRTDHSNVNKRQRLNKEEGISVNLPPTYNRDLLASSSSSSSPTSQYFCNNQSLDLISWNQLAASCQSPLVPSFLL